MLIVMLFLINREKIVFLPPAKEPKKVTLNLANFKPAPKPKPKQKPKPKPIVTPKQIAQAQLLAEPIPQPIVTPEPTVSKTEAKSQLIKDNKVFVAQKSSEENNESANKTIEKKSTKNELVEEKEVAKTIKEEPKKEKIVEKKIIVKKAPTEEELLKKRRERVKRIEEAHAKDEAKQKEKELREKRKRIEILKKMEEEMRIAEEKHTQKLREIRRRRDQDEAPSRQYTSTDLTSALMQGSKSSNFQPSRNQALNRASSTRLIDQLYGSEFDTYSPQQKKFLKANLGRIHMLTQRALVRNGYPEVSVRMGQEGVNIVSFYLHPNGNITELRLEKAIGYTALDENTLRVIRIAYSEYPLPQMRTKIKFYVNYTIN